MPWWVWLLLVVFMLVMLIAGVVYVGVHLLNGFKKVGKTGTQIGERVAAMAEPASVPVSDEPPLFTQPLSVASDRYAQAHEGVVRREEAKRARHVEAWARWSQF